MAFKIHGIITECECHPSPSLLLYTWTSQMLPESLAWSPTGGNTWSQIQLLPYSVGKLLNVFSQWLGFIFNSSNAQANYTKSIFFYLLVLKVSDTVYLDALLNFRVNSILFIIHYKLHLASMTLKLMGVGKWHAKYCHDRLSMSLQLVQLST